MTPKTNFAEPPSPSVKAIWKESDADASRITFISDTLSLLWPEIFQADILIFTFVSILARPKNVNLGINFKAFPK